MMARILVVAVALATSTPAWGQGGRPVGGSAAKREPCLLEVVNGPPVLVAGAEVEFFYARRRSGDCARLADGAAQLREGQRMLAAGLDVEADPDVKDRWFLRVRGVADLTPETHDAEIAAPSGGAGGFDSVARLQIGATRLAAGSTLFVGYADREFDQAQRRKITVTSGLPYAIAAPEYPASGYDILNTVTVAGPGLTLRSSADDLHWWIMGTTWTERVRFRECLELSSRDTDRIQRFLRLEPIDPRMPGEPGKEDEIVGSGACVLRKVDQLSFSVERSQPAPLVVHLELRHKNPKTGDWDVWLHVSVPMASEARLQSIPVPFSEYTTVFCRHPIKVGRPREQTIRNGETKAIEDGSLENGECSVRFDDFAFSEAHPSTARLYGPQVLLLSIGREGAAPAAPVRIALDAPRARPENADGTPDRGKPQDPNGKKDASRERTPARSPAPAGVQEVTITPPAADDKGSAQPYVLELRIAADDPVYAGGAERASPDAKVVDHAYAFRSRLRPRGQFGLPWDFRAFVTIPINFTGLRFPANPREMTSSSDSVHAQAVPIQVGLLGAIEPWDYDRGTPLLTFPMRLLAGFNFIELGTNKFAPATLVGGSITAPLLESPSQLGTSLALGAFWECDLRDAKPLKQSRLLVTFGINVFSLFGAKPAGSP